MYFLRLFKNTKNAVESCTVFCGTLLTRRAAEEEEARRGGGQGRDWGEGALRWEYTSTRGDGVGCAEREARRKKGGRGVAEASVAAAAVDLLLTMDVEQP